MSLDNTFDFDSKVTLTYTCSECGINTATRKLFLSEEIIYCKCRKTKIDLLDTVREE